MLPSRDGAGRRPLLVPKGDRHLLHGINRNLKSVIQRQQDQTVGSFYQSLSENVSKDGSPKVVGGEFELSSKSEIMSSSPNLSDRSKAHKEKDRFGYNRNAMLEIKQSLASFHKDKSPNAGIGVGSQIPIVEFDARPVNMHYLQTLKKMGIDEELAIHALKLSGNKSVDEAVELIQKLSNNENKNGFSKLGMQSYGSKVARKPSFEEKYRQNISDYKPNMPESSKNTYRQSLKAQYSKLERDSHTPPPLPPRTVLPQPSVVTNNPLCKFKTNIDNMALDNQINCNSNDILAYGHKPIEVSRQMRSVPDKLTSPYNQESSSSPINRNLFMGTDNNDLTSQCRLNFLQQNLANPYILPNKPTPVGMNTHVVFNDKIQLNLSIPDRNSSGNSNTTSTPSSPMSTNSSSPQYPQSHSPHQVSPQAHMHLEKNSLKNDSFFQNNQYKDIIASALYDNQSPLYHIGTESVKKMDIKPAAMQAWGAKQPPIVMQQVRSREVQKPILQTATVPIAPNVSNNNSVMPATISPASNFKNTYIPDNIVKSMNLDHYSSSSANFQSKVEVYVPGSSMNSIIYNQFNVNEQMSPLFNEMRMADDNQVEEEIEILPPIIPPRIKLSLTQNSTPRSNSPVQRASNQSPVSVISSTSTTPSTNSDIPDRPPPPYPGNHVSIKDCNQALNDQNTLSHQIVQQFAPTFNLTQQSDYTSNSDYLSEGTGIESNTDFDSNSETSSSLSNFAHDNNINSFRSTCSPRAYKFFMEQHVENVLKNHELREQRKRQLESEMEKVGLSLESQSAMRKLLTQKESNYIRLKRAKMSKSMFEKITTLGIGAFGEVNLVKKKDSNQLYAMKVLRKIDVLKRNQAAHVKAERDILAEADNEWVVKLFYSFQDTNNLYFIMDYIPGGDLMALLIKCGIFDTDWATFYIAELVVAIESVHEMGFIHRDIKPDNILIDRDGHIKLTDFGLCTGFRWTHNSKYYQKNNHEQQDSMDASNWPASEKEALKPLERRKVQNQRCLAHSLVGTPNYIAPEVLLRSGYSACCDWWSVGVILYEMRVGQAPFHADTPDETQLKVVNWKKTLNIPPEAHLSQSTQDLILRLCCDKEERLGIRGSEDIKNHSFFKNFSFENLRSQKAPYIPVIRHACDTSNFDDVDPNKIRNSTDEEDNSNYSVILKNSKSKENLKQPEHAFFEFTFRRFFVDEEGHNVPNFNYFDNFEIDDYEEIESYDASNIAENLSQNHDFISEQIDSNSPVYV